MLFLDGVYVGEADSFARFRWVRAPTNAELAQPTHTIAHHVARYLERQGLLVRNAEHSYLALDSSDEDSMDQLRGHSITCHIAVGAQHRAGLFHNFLRFRTQNTCLPHIVTKRDSCGLTTPARMVHSSNTE